MDVLREREVKDSLERQLTEEQKLRSKFNDRQATNTLNRINLFVTCFAHAFNQFSNDERDKNYENL